MCHPLLCIAITFSMTGCAAVAGNTSAQPLEMAASGRTFSLIGALSASRSVKFRRGSRGQTSSSACLWTPITHLVVPRIATDTLRIYEGITLSSQHAFQQDAADDNIRARLISGSGTLRKLAGEFATHLFSNCQPYSLITKHLQNSGTHATNIGRSLNPFGATLKASLVVIDWRW
jgi:hypothetical protein